jgi:hypothetical protein
MSENKTSKYFKYAIGEIILVVIGILIALQINNWNENRKVLNQQKTFYVQLLSDLKADSIFFNDRLRGLRITRNTFETIKGFEENVSFKLDTINTNGKGTVLFYSGFSYTSNVFDNNEDIYTKLLNEDVKENFRKYRSIYGYVLGSYRNLNTKLLEISDVVGSRHYKQLRINKKDSSVVTLRKIYSDMFLRSNVDIVFKYLENVEKRTKEFIEQNRTLSKEIEKKLKDD